MVVTVAQPFMSRASERPLFPTPFPGKYGKMEAISQMSGENCQTHLHLHPSVNLPSARPSACGKAQGSYVMFGELSKVLSK